MKLKYTRSGMLIKMTKHISFLTAIGFNVLYVWFTKEELTSAIKNQDEERINTKIN